MAEALRRELAVDWEQLRKPELHRIEPAPVAGFRSRLRGRYGVMGLLLVMLLAGTSAAAPPEPRSLPAKDSVEDSSLLDCRGTGGPVELGYKVPGRNPDSRMPWEFFLGNAAHRLIAYMYKVRHPSSVTFHNKETLLNVVQTERLGDWTLLTEAERKMRPDIMDLTMLSIFEIKPCHERGLQEGLRQVGMYLATLNRVTAPTARFSGGTDFQGEVLVQFARGMHIWRLEWRTTTPGVTLYRWTRSRERLDSAAAAYQTQQWLEISGEELKQYGGWVGQAVEDMVERREQLASFSGAVGAAIDFIGTAAVLILSSAPSGSRGSSPSAGQPAQAPPPGGKVLPFPSKPPPSATPARPAAGGM
jgi:hypothetical protein